MSRDLVKAMGWVTLAAFLFALLFTLPKLAGAAVPPLQVAFLRYLAFFDEWPRPAAIAGAAMIVAGAIWLARRPPVNVPGGANKPQTTR